MTAQHILATLFAGTNQAEGYAAAQRELAGIIERERRAAKVDALRDFATNLRSIPPGVNRAHDYWISQECAADEADHCADEIERGDL